MSRDAWVESQSRWGWKTWLTFMLAAGVIVFTVIMAAHSAHAKGHDDGGTVLRPRGPGGPPVVIEGGHWRVVSAFFDDNPVGGTATMGDPTGPWVWDTEAECNAALKNDPRVQERKAKVAAMAKNTPTHVQVRYFCARIGGEGERVD